MKKIFSLLVVLLLMACSSDSGGPGKDENTMFGSTTVRELTQGEELTDTISSAGQVDWYHIRAVEANNMLQIKCSSNTYRPDVEILVTVFQADDSGKKTRLYADHAPEGSLQPANIKLNIYIDTPKDLYLSVRDLMDDDFSDNPYFISAEFAGRADGNDNFSQATTIAVDDSQTCQTDQIDYIGDVDCFRFETLENGIYDIFIDFTPFSGGTDVELAIDLYDDNGLLIESVEQNRGNSSHLLLYLGSGHYYVLIDDYGKDDFDTVSPYRICVTSVESDEEHENDTMEAATTMGYDSSVMTFSASGSLDYWGDQDWYRVPVSGIGEYSLKVLNISFDDIDNAIDLNYKIHLIDSGNNVLLTHDFIGGSDLYQTQIKASQGDHYLMIEAENRQDISRNTPYTISITVMDVDDPAEQGSGNNTIDTAISLNPNEITPAKIAFRGDEDWYSITINDTSSPQVLAVYLDTGSRISNVEYSLSIIHDRVLKNVYDANGNDGPTRLKSSVLVPATGPSNSVTYYFRVYDYQGDEGDGVNDYQINTTINPIPELLPDDSHISSTGSYVHYYSETSEIEDITAQTIELEHTSLVHKNYKVNTQLLDFHSDDPVDGITKTTLSGITTVSFPWIGGYIDFQGDQDWFLIDFQALADAGSLPAGWYYEVSIDLHTGAPGSLSEYVWKLYRDRHQDQILVDRIGSSSGFFASAGDPDTTASAFDITTPETGHEFWVGDLWAGKFYLSVSDFNYIGSSEPDDDWGYDIPYYFKIHLVFYPDVSHP